MNEIKQLEGLKFLLSAAHTISAKQTADETLQALVCLIHDHFHPDAVSIARIEPDQSLTFCAASGSRAQKLIGTQMAPGTGVVGWVARLGHLLWVPDAYADPRFRSDVDERINFTTRAILAIPMLVKGEVLAVLEFINPAPDTDIEAVSDITQALALMAAPVIQHAELTERANQAEQRYQLLFEMDPDPIVILSPKGEILEANQTAQETLRLDAEGLTPADLVSLGIVDGAFPGLSEEAQAGTLKVWEFKPPGSERTFEARLSYLPGDSPSGAYVWIGHDITDRVAVERNRQELAQMVVHDLRVPLCNVINSLDVVLAAWRERDATMPIEQILEIGLRSARRMERLVNDILDAARLDTSERTLTVEQINVAELVAEAVESVIDSVKRRDQTLEVELAPDLPLMTGDPDLLRRVLVNLLSNAIKYTQDEGEIALSVVTDDDVVRFTVADNGPGIAKEHQESIFSPFVRGDAGRIRGAGIGLAFCRLAVKAHGGSISVQSEPGKGATFTFTVPCVLPKSALYYEEPEA